MRISIVIPVYNASKYIGQCIDSILSQSFQDIEVILVNDASKDDSVEVIKNIVKDDSRFVLLEHNANMGAMKARETGYLNARGDYIVFCDSDDMLPQTALEDLFLAIKNTGADIVIGQFERIGCDGNKINEVQNKLLYGTDSNAVFKSLLKGECSHSLWGRIFKRSLFDEHIKCEENFNNAEDGLLFYQLVDKSSVVLTIDEVVYVYQNVSLNSNTASKLTEERAYSIVYFENFIQRYFKSDEELWQLYQNNYVLVIVSLLKRGLPKRFVFDNVTGIELNYRVLLRPFKGMKRFVVFLFLRCDIVRYLLIKSLHVKWYVLKGGVRKN